MGGATLAISNKFILLGAALILPARIGHHPVKAVIDPAAPVSMISPVLANRLHLASPSTASESPVPLILRHPLNIGIGAEEFELGALSVGKTPSSQKRDFLIGKDILAAHIWDIDFARGKLRLVPPSEYRSETRHLHPIEIMQDEGAWYMPARVGASKEVRALLNLGDRAALQIDPSFIASHPANFAKNPLSVQSGDANIGSFRAIIPAVWKFRYPVAIGLDAFTGTRMLIDFPHKKIWVSG